jgi:hypothetical protein
MNEFWFIVAVFAITAVIAGVWCIAKALFERWLNNDWCKHDWGKWEALDKGTQYRFCKKCNKAEKRYP